MTKHLLIAFAAAGTLIGAAPPEMDAVVAADKPSAGAATSEAAVKPAPKAAPAPRVVASGGTYPACSATVRDRCNQSRGYAPARTVRHQHLAMRAGERG